jgi:hypothetical protein
MSDKPSYLGLLNAISVAETRAHAYFTAWAEVTKDDCVREVLLKVAAREGEHGMSFAKRINELGYQVRYTENPDHDERMRIAGSDRSDCEKAEKLGLGKLAEYQWVIGGSGPDVFDKIFADHSIDIATGELLGRYIAEERDSGRLLRACYEQLMADADATPAGAAAGDRLASIESKIDALCGAVESLCAAVSAGANGAKANARA